MSDNDDGFGPVARSRGGGRVRTRAPVRAEPASVRLSREVPAPPPADDGFGPVQGGRRRGRGRRLGRTLLLVVLVLLLAVVGTGVALALSANSRITRIPVRNLRPADGQMNVLLVGSDSRDELTRRQRRRLGTGSSTEGARTDTILLLSVRGSRAAMLSFPRDLYVERCDDTTGRINVAYAIGGPSCLVGTVSEVSGIPITHYMEIDFLGFSNMVSAAGGVRMCLKEPISDADAHIDLPAGCQRLNGKEALGFVRVRKIDNDFGRIERQQRFLKALATQIAQPSTLTDVPRLFSTVNATAEALTTDRRMGLFDLARLALAGRGMATGSLRTLAVPGTPQVIGGASVVVPDEAAAEAVYASFRDGSVLRAAGEGRAALTPADIELEVVNGAGVPGLAGRASRVLGEAGFTVTGVSNTDRVERTVVRFTAGHRPEARFLAAQIPGGAAVERVESGSPLVLVVGPDAGDLGR